MDLKDFFWSNGIGFCGPIRSDSGITKYGFSVPACPGSVPEQDESRGKAKARIRFAACHRARGWLGDRGGNAPARSQGCVRLRASEGLVAGFIGFGLSLGLLQCNNRLSTFQGTLSAFLVGGF